MSPSLYQRAGGRSRTRNYPPCRCCRGWRERCWACGTGIVPASTAVAFPRASPTTRRCQRIRGSQPNIAPAMAVRQDARPACQAADAHESRLDEGRDASACQAFATRRWAPANWREPCPGPEGMEAAASAARCGCTAAKFGIEHLSRRRRARPQPGRKRQKNSADQQHALRGVGGRSERQSAASRYRQGTPERIPKSCVTFAVAFRLPNLALE